MLRYAAHHQPRVLVVDAVAGIADEARQMITGRNAQLNFRAALAQNSWCVGEDTGAPRLSRRRGAAGADSAQSSRPNTATPSWFTNTLPSATVG